MSRISRKVDVAEPIGIVISRGSREEPRPTFWSYEWAPGPVDHSEEQESKAA